MNLYRRVLTMFLYRMLSSYCQNWATGITSSCRFTEVSIWVAAYCGHADFGSGPSGCYHDYNTW